MTSLHSTSLLTGAISEIISYLTENAVRVVYQDQPANAVSGNNSCLLWASYSTRKYIVWARYGEPEYQCGRLHMAATLL